MPYDANTSSASSGKMVQFYQIARGQIKDGTFLVISMRNDGKLAVAQQVEAFTGTKPIHMFLKGALEIEDYSTLYTIMDLYQQAVDWLKAEGMLKESA
jgi:hypothetical protein